MNKSTLIATLSLVFAAGVNAAEQADTLSYRLHDVSVSANRQIDQKVKVAQQVNSFDVPAIVKANIQTAADLLASDGMLTVQKSQQGGGSPIIRGFEASRVLLVVDRVRMNNLIYRSGHLQNVITIDPEMLERVEVLYGPSSVTYGGGALGGAVVFQTKRPKLSLDGGTLFGGNAMMRYASANTETTGHFDFSIGGSKFASLTSVTYSNFGDLRAGRHKNPFIHDDEYIHRPFDVVHSPEGNDVLVPNTKSYHQLGSGYQQYDLLQKFLWRPTDEITHLFNFQFSNTSDVPRYDRLTDMKGSKPKFAQWYYGPQERLLASYTIEADNALGGDRAVATVAYQNIGESRHNRKFDNPLLGSRKERVNVVSLTSDWLKRLNDANHLHLGIDGALNWLSSTAYTTNVNTGERGTLDTRYPDGGNHMHNIEAYYLHQLYISPKLTFSDGVRLGFSSLYSKFDSREYFSFLARDIKDVKQNNFTYSIDLGLNYNPTEHWRFAAAASTGYYVPNVDDVGKVFDSQPGMVVVPNPSIKPEQAINVDLRATRFTTDRFMWETSFFGTYLFDAITLKPYSLDGRTQLDYDGEMSDIYANVNNKRAWLWGFTTHMNFAIDRDWRADATVSYTNGRVVDGQDAHGPLDHIPPVYGRVAVSYTLPSQKASFEAYSMFNGQKGIKRYNLDGEDNIGYATVAGINGKGLPAWFTLNARAQWNVNANVTLQGGIENILDTEYRTFGSGINAPGRSIIASLRCTF